MIEGYAIWDRERGEFARIGNNSKMFWPTKRRANAALKFQRRWENPSFDNMEVVPVTMKVRKEDD